ncbi:MAG: sorbosone dehydrogenase family protein [Methylotenera sp.]|uniref:PQQ-dependent sugar dehydrogenase n=1 Tax=Methylotenera sp. TaxID=2051956 RepID=UPI002489249B|nr:sorbosone dehydrogenase family protein [Methylotenera sp.]MDI1308069.1 sorbosone dehydrogenase family protein [Methylotenera sp.]
MYVLKYQNKARISQQWLTLLLIGFLFTTLTACRATAQSPPSIGIGANPDLPAPQLALIPTVNIAPAIGWPADTTPTPANDLTVRPFARDLNHPRWLYVLPNGDVLVAETNAPAKPEDNKGIKAKIKGMAMKRAGAGVSSANQISILRDTNGDGKADVRSVLLEDLNAPFGMSLIGNKLYIANSDAILMFPYTKGELKISAPATKLIDLPAGLLNHHWTKNIIASKDGSKLYVTIGSNSNVAENGLEAEKDRAAIWEVEIKTGKLRIFASGLRNPNGLAWEPESNKLWTVVNERDELGNDLVPDYLTSVQDGGFYGWPYSYFGQHVDERVKPQQPALVAKAIVPDYALGAHTASLGLTSSRGSSLPERFKNGMFIGQHGSWNRKPASGYKVIFVPFKDGKPVGLPLNVLTGFLSESGKAYGRPVGVALDKEGALLVADDVGNIVWRVSANIDKR